MRLKPSSLIIPQALFFLFTTNFVYANSEEVAVSSRETIAKPLTGKQRQKQEEKLRKELETPYKHWVAQDVAYIISDEERQVFNRLQTDDERQNFIESFWLRRDPTPDTEENEFKEEHYRRIAYANDKFASGIPGWKTDRGKIYIMYGPPAEIEPHPSGGSYERPMEEGGGSTSTYPFETWRYRRLDDIGTNITIEFVDPTMSGEYHMTMDPSEKDALLRVPGVGLTLMEQIGLAQKGDRINGINRGIGQQQAASSGEFERLEQFVGVQRPPKAPFKDLEAIVNSNVRYNLLPMKTRADFMRITNSSVMTNITLQFDRRDLQFEQKDGVAKALVNLHARISSMSRKTVNQFEDVVSVEAPAQLLGEAVKGQSVYQKSVPLPPGLYRLNVVAKDVISGAMINYEMTLNVPRYDDEKLASSSIVLADIIERVPTKGIGSGPFVIGTSKVRPRVNDTFAKDEKLGIYLQLYNFAPGEKTNKPNGVIEYEVTKNGSNQPILEFSEEVSKIENASSSQTTIEKLLPLKGLEAGHYTLRMKVLDKNNNQTLTPSAAFTVL